MNELVKDITVEDLDGDQRLLAEIIGIELYKILVTEWGSDAIYIGNCRKAVTVKRNKAIINDFNCGYKIKDLIFKYNLTRRSINHIIRVAKHNHYQEKEVN